MRVLDAGGAVTFVCLFTGTGPWARVVVFEPPEPPSPPRSVRRR